MIRITRQTDYGIVLLLLLARDRFSGGGVSGGSVSGAGLTRQELADDSRSPPHTAAELAGESHLPLPMVSKILKLLTRVGLLISHRGVRGGYQLARSPDEVTVTEMITALEGPIAITACVETSETECEHSGCCPAEANWQVINRSIREVLDRITLSEMTGRLPASLPSGGCRSRVSENIREGP